MTQARLTGLTMVLLAGAALGGCSGITDPPAATRAPGVVAPRGRSPDLVSGLVPDGTIMTMVDEDDGTRYTLDMSRRAITRSSDGVVLELTQGQADSAASVFGGAVQYDPSIPGLEAVAQLASGTLGCTGVGNNYCDASTLRDPMVMRPVRDTVKGRRGVHPLIRPASAGGSAVMASLLAGDPCTNIINAALPKVIQYRGYRSGFLQQGFAYAFEKGRDGVVEKMLPPGTGPALSFSEAMANFFTAQIAVGWLAGNWTTYECRNTDIAAGPYYHIGGTYTTTPSGGSYVCAYERWQISWDGGSTWEGIWVRVCTFQS